MAAYLDLATFKLLSIMPASYADEIEALEAGWIETQLNYWSRWIDSRLRKRYAVPFEAPVSEVVTGWLTRIVTLKCYQKRGVDPTDAQFADVKDDAEHAQQEIKEAAESRDGLFDLPLRADDPSSAITKGAPLGYSEVSPYTWGDVQLVETESDG